VEKKMQQLNDSSNPEDVAKLAKYEVLELGKMIQESHWLQHKIEHILSQLSHHMHYHDHVHGLKAPDGVHERVSMRDKGMAFALEEVLCHNDLLSGNLMVMHGSPFLNSEVEDNSAEVRLIDYEYAAYNYRAYDLANHFCGKLNFLSYSYEVL
jgi:ethanolamine kinase